MILGMRMRMKMRMRKIIDVALFPVLSSLDLPHEIRALFRLRSNVLLQGDDIITAAFLPIPPFSFSISFNPNLPFMMEGFKVLTLDGEKPCEMRPRCI